MAMTKNKFSLQLRVLFHFNPSTSSLTLPKLMNSVAAATVHDSWMASALWGEGMGNFTVNRLQTLKARACNQLRVTQHQAQLYLCQEIPASFQKSPFIYRLTEAWSKESHRQSKYDTMRSMIDWMTNLKYYVNIQVLRIKSLYIIIAQHQAVFTCFLTYIYFKLYMICLILGWLWS